jgi:hypothetical protein
MTAFDWFKERNRFYRECSEKFLKWAEDLLANAVGDDEKMFAEQAIEEAKNAIDSLNRANASGNTEEGRDSEKDALDSISQCEIRIKLAEEARDYFTDRPKP